MGEGNTESRGSKNTKMGGTVIARMKSVQRKGTVDSHRNTMEGYRRGESKGENVEKEKLMARKMRWKTRTQASQVLFM